MINNNEEKNEPQQRL